MPNKKLEEIVDIITPELARMKADHPSRTLQIKMHPRDWEEVFDFKINGVEVVVDSFQQPGLPVVSVRPFDGPS